MKTIFGLFLAGLFLLSGLMVLDLDREPVVYHKKQVLVYSGDTLWGIARRCGVTLSSLIAANPQIKNPNLIYPGNEVRLP